MGTYELTNQVVTVLEALHYHEQIDATPPATGKVDGPEIKYFDHVWLGMPKKMPMNMVNFAAVEASGEPSFQTTSCPTHGRKEVDIMVSLYCKGKTEIGTAAVYQLTDKVLDAIMSNSKWSNNCMGSDIQDVIYGSITDPEGKKIVAGARITFKAYMVV